MVYELYLNKVDLLKREIKGENKREERKVEKNSKNFQRGKDTAYKGIKFQMAGAGRVA